jgi:uncharacterized membrane protein
MTDAVITRRPIGFGVFLLVTGLVGWIGATILLVEKIHKLIDPDAALACDVNPFLSCGALFETWQSSLLGFPNPILGVAGFVAPIAVGTALLAGARFERWFWLLFTAGVFGAWVFVTWLFTQSVFVIGILCPYCMLVWAFTIPMFWYLLAWGLKHGTLFGPRTRAFGEKVFPFAWVIVLVNYAVIVVSIIVQFPLLMTLLFGA